MLRTMMFTAAAAALAAAPIAAQAATARTATPVAGESEDIAGTAGHALIPIAIAIVLAAILAFVIFDDDDLPESP